MKEIELTKGCKTRVDDEDFPALDMYHWYTFNSRGKLYAVRKPSKSPVIFMHRVILPPPDGLTVDHIDGDGLNNQRHNLRVATRRDQQGNRVGHGMSGSKGVRVMPSGRYSATLGLSTGQVYIGTYDTIEEAAAAYAQAARAHFGEFALTEGGEAKK